MVKFILPPPEPVLQVKIAAAQCDWCGNKDGKCIISTFPVTPGHVDYTTEMQLLKTSALNKLKEVEVMVEKQWHECPQFASVCIPCVQAIAQLTKKGA